MKMKKFISAVLVATMVLSMMLTGCGDGGSAKKGEGEIFHIME